MKNILFLIFISLVTITHSQVLTEEEFKIMVGDAQQKCVGAHESVVRQINEDVAKSIWGKNVRFNQAKIVRFFNRPSGEKVSAGVDVNMSLRNDWVYTYDQKSAADLMTENGVRVTQSYNTLWIVANQVLLAAENTLGEHKIILELYCPQQKFLELLRIGQTQSIEFLITGYTGSVSSNSKLFGVITQVHAEKQVLKCSNGHEFDKDLEYKFCPTCGEPLE